MISCLRNWNQGISLVPEVLSLKRPGQTNSAGDCMTGPPRLIDPLVDIQGPQTGCCNMWYTQVSKILARCLV